MKTFNKGMQNKRRRKEAFRLYYTKPKNTRICNSYYMKRSYREVNLKQLKVDYCGLSTMEVMT